MKTIVVRIPIFETSVVVCAGCSVEEAEHEIYNLQDSRAVVSFPRGGKGAYFIPEGGNDIFVWIGDPENHQSTVVHEVVHVAFGVCDIRGMSHDEELIASLVKWLSENVADKLINTLAEH